MARLNTRTEARRRGGSPIVTTGVETVTHEGGQGFLRDEKSELFLLATTRFYGEDAFYEKADAGAQRYRALVAQVARHDPRWAAAFLAWLRGPDANIRTGAIVGAAVYAKTLQAVPAEDREALGAPTIRSVVSSVLQRAEEPGEFMAFWIAEYGRTRIPSAVKRGVGDAVIRLGTEYAYAKYDSSARGVRYADVLNLVHPGDRKGSSQALRGAWQHELFEHATSAPYRDVEPGESLTMLRERQGLSKIPAGSRRALLLREPERVVKALGTWEALAGWLQGPMDAAAWEAVIPQMGVMALIRNLRNFDQAGISRAAQRAVAAKISDPEVVAKSRQLPYRWLSAYKAVHGDTYRVALGDALDLSTRNIPELDGTSLVLVDVSGSMDTPMSSKSAVTRAEAAGLFGSALAARLGDRVILVAYGSTSQVHALPKGGSVLRHAESFAAQSAYVGHGTNTWQAVSRHFDGQDRIFIFTDEQTHDSRQTRLGGARVYTWNLAGYRAAHAPSGGRFQTMGGLTDATFRLIPFLERGADAAWPWEA